MSDNQKFNQADGLIVCILILLNVVIIRMAFISNESWYAAMFLSLPVMMIVKRMRHQKIKYKK